MAHEPNTLPTTVSSFSIRDLWLLASLLITTVAPMELAISVLYTGVFHFQASVPIQEQPHSDLFAVIMVIAMAGVGVAGKYLWLLAVSPFVSKADLSPWIAYGIPRRIHPLDRAFLERFYRR